LVYTRGLTPLKKYLEKLLLPFHKVSIMRKSTYTTKKQKTKKTENKTNRKQNTTK